MPLPTDAIALDNPQQAQSKLPADAVTLDNPTPASKMVNGKVDLSSQFNDMKQGAQDVLNLANTPARKIITGKSFEDIARDKDLTDAGNADFKGMSADEIKNKLGDIQDSTFKNAILAQGADLATNPMVLASAGGKYAGMAKDAIGDNISNVKNNIAKFALSPEFSPTASDFKYGHDARRVMQSMPDVIGDDLNSTKAAIVNKTQEVGKSIGNTIANSPSSNQPIGLTSDDVVGHIDDKISNLNKADPHGNAATINKLQEKKIALLNNFDSNGNVTGPVNFENMTPQQAFDYKEQKLGDIKFTGSDATDTKAVNSALQQSRGNIVQKMNNILPEIKPLNQDYGDLKTASNAVDRVALKSEKEGLPSLKINDILTLGMNRWIANPLNRAKLAQYLYTAPQSEIDTVSKIIPDFQKTVNTSFGGTKQAELMGANTNTSKGIDYQKPMLRSDRALPSPQDAGQSSGPVIQAEGQKSLPKPNQRPLTQQATTPEVINGENPVKKLPYNPNLPEGAIRQGNNFTVKGGKSDKGVGSGRILRSGIFPEPRHVFVDKSGDHFIYGPKNEKLYLYK